MGLTGPGKTVCVRMYKPRCLLVPLAIQTDTAHKELCAGHKATDSYSSTAALARGASACHSYSSPPVSFRGASGATWRTSCGHWSGPKKPHQNQHKLSCILLNWDQIWVPDHSWSPKLLHPDNWWYIRNVRRHRSGQKLLNLPSLPPTEISGWPFPQGGHISPVF